MALMGSDASVVVDCGGDRQTNADVGPRRYDLLFKILDSLFFEEEES